MTGRRAGWRSASAPSRWRTSRPWHPFHLNWPPPSLPRRRVLRPADEHVDLAVGGRVVEPAVHGLPLGEDAGGVVDGDDVVHAAGLSGRCAGFLRAVAADG